MSTNNVTLVWQDTNLIEKGHKIYRSDSPMDVNNMPTAFATLAKNSTSYTDMNLTVGDTWFYRVSAFIDGHEMFSEEIELTVTKKYSIYTVSDDDTTIKLNGEGIEDWISTQHTNNVNDVAIDANDNVFTVSDDQLLIMTNSADTKQWEFNGHSAIINSVSVNNGNEVFTADNSGILKKIDYSGNEVWSISAHSSAINQVYADYGGVVYTVSNDNTLKRWDNDGQLDKSLSLSSTPNSVKTNIYTSAIIVAEGNDVVVYDYNMNEQLRITSHSNTVNEVVFDTNGYIVSGSSDGTVKKTDFEGNEVYSHNNGNSISSVAINKNGDVFFTDSVFDLKMLNNSGNVVWTYNQHTATINRVNTTRLVELLPNVDFTVGWENLMAQHLWD